MHLVNCECTKINKCCPYCFLLLLFPGSNFLQNTKEFGISWGKMGLHIQDIQKESVMEFANGPFNIRRTALPGSTWRKTPLGGCHYHAAQSLSETSLVLLLSPIISVFLFNSQTGASCHSTVWQCPCMGTDLFDS